MKEITKEERDLLLKCMKDEANIFEQVQAWEWINGSEFGKEYYKNLKEAWIANSMNKSDEDAEVEKSWKRVEQKIILSDCMSDTESGNRSNKRSREDRVFSLLRQRIAAAVVVFLLIGGLGSLIFFSQRQAFLNGEVYSIIESPRGSKTMVTLSDGSKVWLNADSRLKFKKSFNKSNRDVYLQGEGYFVVAKNENLNFRVHTTGIVVKAIGTEFNVRAYADEDRIETTLIEGLVSISRNESTRNDQTIVLKPNQKAYFPLNNPNAQGTVSNIGRLTDQVADKGGIPEIESLNSRPARIIIENNVNTETVTSWKEKRWVFERENMKSLATKLERLYDVEFVFTDPEVKDFYLTGTLEQESLEQVLKALQLTLPINFKVSHDTVYLGFDQDLVSSHKQILRNRN